MFAGWLRGGGGHLAFDSCWAPRFGGPRRGYVRSMSEDREAAIQPTEPEHQPEDDEDRGIEITSGEPNTFEPEEDPDAADAS